MAINDKIGLYLKIQMDKSMAFLNVVQYYMKYAFRWSNSS